MKKSKTISKAHKNWAYITYILLAICLLGYHTGSAQQGFPTNPTQINEIPPSPTVWEFEKYGNYPVSMHTGVPNISIPITTAQSGAIQVPISLNYHASGIKVDQKASWVGLGWTLNAGGKITRTVRGAVDEKVGVGYIETQYQTTSSLDPTTDYYVIEEMMNGNKDSEPDIFNYDFMGYSGKFVFNRAANRANATIALIPYNDLKITPVFTGNQISSFTIMTPEGIEAEFDYPETASDPRTGGFLGNHTITSNNVWHLKKLTAPNGFDEITFEYKLIGTVLDERYTESESVNYPDPCNYSNHTFSSTLTSSGTFYGGVKRIEKITYKNGYILFDSSADNRIDDPDDEGLRLDEIRIYSGTPTNPKHIKTFELNYGYFGTIPAANEYKVRLKLQEVDEVAPDGSRNNPHQFTYKELGVYALPDRLSRSQDYWGYDNGRSNASLAPKYLASHPNGGQSFFIGDADRDPNPIHTQSGMIQRITYPTLGYTEFEFENNTVTVMEAGSSVQHTAGGLRVKEITSFNSDGSEAWTKAYEYTQPNDPTKSSGVYNGNAFISPEDFFSTKEYHFNYYGNPGTSCGSHQGGAEHYIQTLNAGISSATAMANNYATVFYSAVKEYNGSVNNHEGYKWYHYADTKDYFSIQGSGALSFNIDRSWDRGQLLLEETFENGNSTPIATTTNVYEEIFVQTAVSGFKPATLFNVEHIGFLPTASTNIPASTFRNLQYFLTSYQEPIPWKRMASSTSSIDGITTQQNYFYDTNAKHTNVIRTTTIGSEGETLETKTYYPEDITSTSALLEGGNLSSAEYQQIDKLKKDDQHRPATPIQTVTREDGTIVSIQRTLYDTFGNAVYPSEGKFSKGNSLFTYAEYHDYTDGRPTHLSKEDGPDVSYVWGYNKQYPVAKIENATYAAVLATGVNLTTLNSLTSSEAAKKNELEKIRTGLPNALITTYTYDPMIGVTSITDPRGYTMTYEYDVFNRLEYVRDANGDLISENTYNYKN